MFGGGGGGGKANLLIGSATAKIFTAHLFLCYSGDLILPPSSGTMSDECALTMTKHFLGLSLRTSSGDDCGTGGGGRGGGG